jgi:predicted transcriptional regulator
MAKMEPALDFRRRREIHDLIRAHPGLHLRELERRLGTGLGDLRHHLRVLEDAGFVISQDDGYRTTYFPVRGFHHSDARLVALLRQGTPRRILLALLEGVELGFHELREAVKVSKSTLSFHLAKLVEASLVDASQRDGRNRYGLRDPSRLTQVLSQNKESFLDAAIDRVVAAWMP